MGLSARKPAENITEPSPPPEHRPRLHWYQYSLRSLFLLTLLAAIGMSWFAAKMRRAETQRQVLDALRPLVVTEQLQYDYEYGFYASGDSGEPPTCPGPPWLRRLLGHDFFARVYCLWLRYGGDRHVTDADLALVENLTELRELQLDDTLITDAGLERLLRALPKLEQFDICVHRASCSISDGGLYNLRFLSHLKGLSIDHPDIGDAALAHIRDLHGLESLSLRGTQVTDAGLTNLEGLTEMRWLSLNGSAITDAGLEHLRAMQKLEDLNLQGTSISDAGMVHLRGFSRLEKLCLASTKVTGPGLVHLRALPTLRVLFLNNAKLNDEALEHVAAVSTLQELDLPGVALAPSHLRTLEKMKNLRLLWLDEKAEKATVARLRKAIPSCEIWGVLH